ncbi:hypothetical protein TcYC6_0078300 [Trypanosoma cruzi]|nr:hypothetical protein TcYC6_0078300 [Trypanosoma cruzi]
MCPHTVDGQVNSAAGWAGGRQSVARLSAKICGAHVWKRFRRRQRRADLLSKERKAPPTQELIVIRRARAGPSKSGQESHRTCAQSRDSMPDVCLDTRDVFFFFLLHRRALVVRCARLPSYSWTFLQYSRFTAVRKPTCQASTQSFGRDRGMTASASAVTLRGIPQCHEENVESAVRPQSSSESGTAQISSLTSSCTASGPRQSDSIAERESVAAGTRVGDWDAARRGTGKRLRPCSVAGHSARQEHARLPAAVR